MKYTEKFLSARMYSDYGPYIVPEGHYFLMGDNRNNSNDSRSSHVGAVPRNMILGKVEAVLWHQIPSTLDDWRTTNLLILAFSCRRFGRGVRLPAFVIYGEGILWQKSTGVKSWN